MGNAYLLTGKPRVGKTTVMKDIVASIGSTHCGGFYTAEIYDQTRTDPRMGFRLLTLDGNEGTLAHLHIDSPLRLGRYGIDVTCLETIGIPALLQAATTKKLIVIDEIGFMQAFSEAFKLMLEVLLNGQQPMLGTITQRPHPWLNTIKQHPGVSLYEVREDNRALLPRLLTRKLHQEGHIHF